MSSELLPYETSETSKESEFLVVCLLQPRIEIMSRLLSGWKMRQTLRFDGREPFVIGPN